MWHSPHTPCRPPPPHRPHRPSSRAAWRPVPRQYNYRYALFTLALVNLCVFPNASLLEHSQAEPALFLIRLNFSLYLNDNITAILDTELANLNCFVRSTLRELVARQKVDFITTPPIGGRLYNNAPYWVIPFLTTLWLEEQVSNMFFHWPRTLASRFSPVIGGTII